MGTVTTLARPLFWALRRADEPTLPSARSSGATPRTRALRTSSCAYVKALVGVGEHPACEHGANIAVVERRSGSVDGVTSTGMQACSINRTVDAMKDGERILPLYVTTKPPMSLRRKG